MNQHDMKYSRSIQILAFVFSCLGEIRVLSIGVSDIESRKEKIHISCFCEDFTVSSQNGKILVSVLFLFDILDIE